MLTKMYIHTIVKMMKNKEYQLFWLYAGILKTET